MKDFKMNSNIVLVILLVISLWMNYSNYNQIEIIQNDLSRTSNMLQNDVNDIGSDVSRILNDFKKESMWVRESSIDITNFTDDLKHAEIEISISLNEKNKDENLYVLAIPRKSDETFKFQVPENNGLTYKVKITLPSDYNYEMQLVGENDTFSRSGMLNKVYISNYINEIINIDGELLGGQYHEGDQKGYYSFFVTVGQVKESEFAEYLKDLEITEVKADVYYGNRYINTIDFLKETNYIPMDINDISNSIPERAVHDITNEFERKYFFSGKYEIEGEPEFPDMILVIKAKDNKGNTCEKMIGDFYDYDEMIEKYMKK